MRGVPSAACYDLDSVACSLLCWEVPCAPRAPFRTTRPWRRRNAGYRGLHDDRNNVCVDPKTDNDNCGKCGWRARWAPRVRRLPVRVRSNSVVTMRR